MIDEKLYQETFSRLRASRKAKEEVFQMTKNKKRVLPRALRAAAIAAVTAVILAVSAGAVNAVTDGWLFRFIGMDGGALVYEDDRGNRVSITTSGGSALGEEDGRMVLDVGGAAQDGDALVYGDDQGNQISITTSGGSALNGEDSQLVLQDGDGPHMDGGDTPSMAVDVTVGPGTTVSEGAQ